MLRERDERLESLKALVNQLGHDFNNFMVPLLGYVTLIREEGSDSGSIAQYALRLETSARRVEGFIDTVLLAVRPQRRYCPKLTDLSALIHSAVDTWKAALPLVSQIKVSTSLAPCQVMIDENQWTNIVQHLLSNARFALAAGGNLELTLRPATLTPERGAELNISERDVFEFVVKDDGFGMPPHLLRRACEPFFTTRPKGQASGLGLTLVHSVVQLHGGQVSIESTPDVGTTVHIWLPASSSSGATMEPQYARAGLEIGNPSVVRSGSKILFVDDDPLIREVVKSYFKNVSLDVMTAQHGSEGLKLFQKYHREIGLVVSDIIMPVMGGIEFYQKLHQFDPGARLIFISGDVDTAEKELAALGDAVERPLFIRKPFALKALADTVRGYLPPT